MKNYKLISEEKLKPWHVAAVFFGLIILAGIIYRLINA